MSERETHFSPKSTLRRAVPLLLTLTMGLGAEVSAQDSGRLTNEEISALAPVAKIALYVESTDGSIYMGHGGLVRNDKEGHFELCTVNHNILPPSEPMGTHTRRFVKFGLSSNDFNRANILIETTLFETGGEATDNLLPDPAVCAPISNQLIDTLEDKIPNSVESIPVINSSETQVGDEVIIFSRDKTPIYLEVAEEIPETKQLKLIPNQEGNQELTRGDSGSLAYQKTEEGEIVAVGVYSSRVIEPNRTDPENPTISYLVQKF